MGSPVSSYFRKRGNKTDDNSWWKNPCDIKIRNTVINGNDEPMKLQTMLDNLKLRAKTARSSVDEFKLLYVESTFDMSFLNYIALFENKYTWISNSTNLPKTLNTPTEVKHLKDIKFNIFLADTFELGQRLAVAFEQCILDKSGGGKFAKEFITADLLLKSMMCEIEHVMMERQVPRLPDVGRDIMTDEYRLMEAESSKNTRDWTVLSTFINMLEYISDVTEYLSAHPEMADDYHS